MYFFIQAAVLGDFCHLQLSNLINYETIPAFNFQASKSFPLSERSFSSSVSKSQPCFRAQIKGHLLVTSSKKLEVTTSSCNPRQAHVFQHLAPVTIGARIGSLSSWRCTSDPKKYLASCRHSIFGKKKKNKQNSCFIYLPTLPYTWCTFTPKLVKKWRNSNVHPYLAPSTHIQS